MAHLLPGTTPMSSCPPYNFSDEIAWMAALGRQALIAQAELTPKPGLVDRRGVGVHTDLSLEIMRSSALAIEPYFRQMACTSRRRQPSQLMRERLSEIGRDAEQTMFRTTGGANSHKGAIWILGLLISAAAMQDEKTASAQSIATTARDIASFQDRGAPQHRTHGDFVARRYGVAGARGEAFRGFPHVIDIGLPMLRMRRARGAKEQVARLDALLGIMSYLDDTSLLYRGGTNALLAAKKGAISVGIVGGCGTAIGRHYLQCLDDELLELKVSPGGSANLLAATMFLDAVEQRRDEVQADLSRF